MDECKVFRGGSWVVVAWVVRAAFRFHDLPGFRYDRLGFRICVKQKK